MKLRQSERSEQADTAHGSLNGTTSVEIVGEPPAGFTRRIECVRFVNKDSAAVTIRLRKTVAGPTHYECDNVVALAVDGKFFPVEVDSVVRLIAGESLTAVMSGAAATLDPTWISSWVDVPVTV